MHAAGLIAAGLLPGGSLLGRMKLFGMPYLERVAINVDLAFLVDKEEEIKEWVEDNTRDGADDVFNALVIGSVIAASNGYWKMSSTIASRIISRLGALYDTAMKSSVLRKPESLMALIYAA
jgi:hypothetical protein